MSGLLKQEFLELPALRTWPNAADSCFGCEALNGAFHRVNDYVSTLTFGKVGHFILVKEMKIFFP